MPQLPRDKGNLCEGFPFSPDPFSLPKPVSAHSRAAASSAEAAALRAFNAAYIMALHEALRDLRRPLSALRAHLSPAGGEARILAFRCSARPRQGESWHGAVVTERGPTAFRDESVLYARKVPDFVQANAAMRVCAPRRGFYKGSEGLREPSSVSRSARPPAALR